MSYQTPLSVFIIWHPDFPEGQQIASSLYSILCRDSSKPLIRSMGIPVYFRSTKLSGTDRPIDINFEESEFTAVVALISDEFVLDEGFRNYVDAIHDECSKANMTRRLYPVSLSKSAFGVTKKLSPINFVRTNSSSLVQEVDPCAVKTSLVNEIRGPILHELCRLLMGMKRATEEKESLTAAPPIKLFISHSKHDESLAEAIRFKDFINSKTQLKTFFDANDIAYGTNFGEEIKKVAHESALVVFQSDSYADREWCRIEVLEAKKTGCPIVIVNAVENGEKRAFPYLGNYPSIRLRDNFLDIINLTLEQVLFNLFSKKSLSSLTSLYGIKTDRVLSTSPEMFNFIQLKEREPEEGEEFRLVIYPDPPLGSEEMDLLAKLDDSFTFITPLTLPAIPITK